MCVSVCGFVFCNLIYVRIVEWILHYACINWDHGDERMFVWKFVVFVWLLSSIDLLYIVRFESILLLERKMKDDDNYSLNFLTFLIN